MWQGHELLASVINSGQLLYQEKLDQCSVTCVLCHCSVWTRFIIIVISVRYLVKMTDLDEDFKEKVVKPKKKSFTDVARAAGIKDATLDILLKEDFDSIEAVKCLSEDIVRSLGLTRGQSCILLQWVQSIQPKKRLSSALSYALPPPAKDKDKEESDIISMLGAVGGTVIPPATDHPSAGNFITRNDGSLDGLNGSYTPHVPLRLADVIKSPRPFEFVDRDFKKSADVKTFADLMYGATIILENAIMGKKGTDISLSMTRHLSFLAQKSAQRYTTESIIQYDDAVRDKVQALGGKWSPDSDSDLCNRYLRVATSQPGQNQPTQRPGRMAQGRVENGDNATCFRFNSAGDGKGCSSKNCHLSHVCLLCAEEHSVVNCPSKKGKK